MGKTQSKQTNQQRTQENKQQSSKEEVKTKPEVDDAGKNEGPKDLIISFNADFTELDVKKEKRVLKFVLINTLFFKNPFLFFGISIVKFIKALIETNFKVIK